MNASNTTYRHPYPREGTDQPRRYAPELDPVNTPVDDRSLADMLVYAHRHAQALAYWAVADPNKEPGEQRLAVVDHWQPFLDGDPLVITALLWRYDFDEWKRIADDYLANGRWAALLEAMLELVLFINGRARRATDQHTPGLTGLAVELDKVFQGTLQSLTRAIIAAYRSLPQPKETLIQRVGRELVSAWWFDVSAVAADAAFAAMNSTQRRDQLSVWRNDLIQAAVYLAKRAGAHFQDILRAEPLHEPHMGLLIAFLQLFQRAQQRLNSLTGRYLDHYYERVLHIQRRPAVPDRAWLLLVLTRHVHRHALSAGRAFKAGKDATGVERHYLLTQDSVFNRAKVKAIRSVYRDPDSGRLHAAAAANSADGMGEPFADKARWSLFGENSLPRAAIGYGVSAPILRIQGGRKEIQLTLGFSPASYASFQIKLTAFVERTGNQYVQRVGSDHAFHQAFVVQGTGPHGWHDAAVVEVLCRHAQEAVQITATFLEDQPLAGFDVNTHGGHFATTDPVLRLVLNPAVTPFHHHVFQALVMASLNLQVAATGDVTMLVQNDRGTVNPARAFLPFGHQPQVGAALYVGSAEVFSKRLDYLRLQLTFKNLPSRRDARIRADILNRTYWQPLVDDMPLFDLDGNTTTLAIDGEPNLLQNMPAQPDLAPFRDRSVDLKRGFVKFTLTGPSDPFGHAGFPRAYTEALVRLSAQEQGQVNRNMINLMNAGEADRNDKVKLAQSLDENDLQRQLGNSLLPATPWVPEAVAVRLDYGSHVTFQWGEAPTATQPVFHHLGPFGSWPTATNGDVGLLPDYQGEGQLYIGLADAEPGSNVRLFFQLIEGGGNPFLAKPSVQWAYLAGDRWQNFRRRDVIGDRTSGLIESGTIEFSLPRDISLHHDAMTTGLVWLRAQVDQHVAALAPAVAVAAQAVEVVFSERGNDPQHLAQPLPAGHIQKLVIKDKAIKRVQQPMASRGGAMEEAGSRYHVRVSERLRHKNRAIATWDYERLVLQAFPQIHKVKCIAHTQPGSELAPGHVMLALIPKLNPDEAFDPYRPAVSQATRHAVKTFVAKRISPFVDLHVANPKYERVKVRARVVVHAGLDASYFEDQLATDLKRMLAPWAFSDQPSLSFGGKLHRSVILNFIEERPYVDYLLDFQVDQLDDTGQLIAANPEALVTTSARSILVTADEHRLQVVAGEDA